MKHETGIDQMSKTMLLSELNALNYSSWTQADQLYRDRLLEEFNKRIEYECKLATECTAGVDPTQWSHNAEAR